MSRTSKLRVGLIGGMGRAPAVGRLFNETGRAEVVAVADLDPAAFEVGRERFATCGADPDLYTDVAEMLKRDDLDWVVIGTPDRTHSALARQVIEAGRNVFVEKPMTQTTAEADGLCGLVQASGVRLAVGFELRYSPVVQVFRRALRSGRIGRPVLGTFVDHVRMGYSFFLRDHRKKQWGRGLLMQKGIHSLDLMNDFADSDPARVSGSGGQDCFGGVPEAAGRHCRNCDQAATCPFSFGTVTSPTWRKGGPREMGEHAFDHCVHKPDSDAEDNMLLLVDYANGFRFTYAGVYFAPQYKRTWACWGTEGMLHACMGHDEAWVRCSRTDGREEDIPLDAPGAGGHGGGDALLVQAVIDATVHDHPLRPDVWDGRASVALAEYGQEAIETHQAATVPPRPEPVP